MKKRIKVNLWLIICLLLAAPALFSQSNSGTTEWKPLADWGHWILGHRNNVEFLQKNHMTVTFGSGAPNFENVSRTQFDSMMTAAKAFNDQYHQQGYIVLRYLSTSLNGDSETRTSDPKKEEIHLLDFYQKRWQDFEDYLGPRPDEDPTTWMMVHPDGTFPHYRYAPYGRETDEGFEAWGCPDNPYYVRYMEGKVRAQAETGIDGSYVDWTHIAGGTCYCRYTRKNFTDYLIKELPAEVSKTKYGVGSYEGIDMPEKRGDQFWMEWISFRGRTVANFHQHLRTVARKYNPHFMISGNVFGGFGYGPIAYDAAGNIEMLGRVDDFIYSEMQEFLDAAPRKDEEGTKITNSPALKFLAAASSGKPTIIYATEITPPIFPDPSEKCLSAMAQMNIAEAVANHAIFREKRETPPGATAMYSFLSNQREILTGAQPYGRIALLASLTPYLADELSFAFSASRILVDKGIHHVMITEEDLLGKQLQSYDLLYVPYLPLLSEKKQQALITYAEKGGTLLVLGASGMKNEYNLSHAKPLLAGLFAGGKYPDKESKIGLGKGSVVYFPLEIPADRFLIPAKEKSGATTFGPAMTDVFADIPEGYTRNRIDSRLRAHLLHAADWLEGAEAGPVSRITSAHPYVEMTMMRNARSGHLLVHMVNYDVTVHGDITPARNVAVEIVLPRDATVKGVRASGVLGPLEPLTDEVENLSLRFSLDQVDVYGLAIIELEK